MSTRSVVVFIAACGIIALVSVAHSSRRHTPEGDRPSAVPQVVAHDEVNGTDFGQDAGTVVHTKLEPEDPAPRKIVKGETVILTSAIGSVNVKNIVPVADEDVSVSQGSGCDLTADGTLTVVGFDGDNVLVRFHKSTKLLRKKSTKEVETEDSMVYPDCPSGTLLFLDRSAYLEATEPSDADLVQKLLKQEHSAKP